MRIRELKGLGLNVELLGGKGGQPASEVVTEIDEELQRDEKLVYDKPEIIATLEEGSDKE